MFRQLCRWKRISFVLLFVLSAFFSSTQAQPALGLPIAAFAVGAALDKEVPQKTTEKQPPTPNRSTRKPSPSRISPFKRQQSLELLRATAQMSLGIGLIGGIGYIIGGKSAITAATFIGPMIGGMLVKPLGKIGSQLCILFIPSLAAPSIRKGIELRKQYEARKYKLTKSMRMFLDATTERYIKLMQTYEYQDKEAESAIEEILSFPIEIKPLDPPLEPITNLLKNYAQEVRMDIANWVSLVVADSKVGHLSKKATPLMFVGEPGCGKTHLAHQLGKLLDIPVEVIDVTKYDRIEGNFFRSSQVDLGLMVDVLLGQNTEQGNFSNKILVLDEIDKALTKDDTGRFVHEGGSSLWSLLHTLLEPQETTIRLNRYGNATYDISQLKIILIANRTFSEVLGKKDAQALESRVNVVQFEGFPNTQKLVLAQEYVQKICTAKSIDATKIDPQVIQDIVDKDNQVGNKGIRIMLKIIDQYLEIWQRGTTISQIAGVPMIQFDINKAYDKQQPQPVIQDSTVVTAPPNATP